MTPRPISGRFSVGGRNKYSTTDNRILAMPSWGNAASFSLLRNGNGEDPAIALLAAAFF
jgi:hypothetical protein